jgi:hypothetical protein
MMRISRCDDTTTMPTLTRAILATRVSQEDASGDFPQETKKE